MLVVAQVVLALQLPFTLIPLIKATSSKAIMGSFASSWATSWTAWASSIAVSMANVLMVADVLWKETAEHAASHHSEDPYDANFADWIAHVATDLVRSPTHLLTTMAVVVLSGAAIALLMWMSVHPVHVYGSLRCEESRGEGGLQGGTGEDVETGPSKLAPLQRPDAENSHPKTFVQHLFADLPIVYVWEKLVSAWRPRGAGSAAADPALCLTPRLLALHTSQTSSLCPEPAGIPLKLITTFLHAHRSDVASVAYSECSVQSHVTQRSDTHVCGASVHPDAVPSRMGRSCRRQFAAQLCCIWEPLFNLWGQLVSIQGRSRPVTGPEMLETVLEGVDRLAQIPGAHILLEQSTEIIGHLPGGLQRSPSLASCLLLSGLSTCTSHSCLEHISPLEKHLAACSRVIRDLNVYGWRDEDLEALKCLPGWWNVEQQLKGIWEPAQFVGDLCLLSCELREAQGVAKLRPCLHFSGVRSNACGDAFCGLLFVTFGIWCLAVVLQLASVEPRPELWGKYVVALNHLQGPLFVSLGLVREKWGVHCEILQLIRAVEGHVKSCGGETSSSKAAAAAFGKGKENLLSVVRRLRSHILIGCGEDRRDSDDNVPAWRSRSRNRGALAHSEGQPRSSKNAGGTHRASWDSRFSSPSPAARQNQASWRQGDTWGKKNNEHSCEWRMRGGKR